MRIRLIPFVLFAMYSSLLMPALAQEPEPYFGRTPAPVMSYRGAPWLERPERETEEQPLRVIHAMELEQGDVVVDMGCGTGYYARKIAQVVGPEGKVIGVDIQPEMLEQMMALAMEEGIANIEPVLGEVDDPKLESGSADWIILVDVYHEFAEPEPMLEAMWNALKPGGKIALLEYREEGNSAAHIKPDHRMSTRQVLKEWNHAGFELVDLMQFLPSQHFFVFQRDPDREE